MTDLVPVLHHTEPTHGQLELHPSWPSLTDDQRRGVNEVWEDMVIPALEDVDRMRRQMEEMQIEAQDARGVARSAHEESERRAEQERLKRQELLAEVARLRTRVLELETGVELPDAA